MTGKSNINTEEEYYRILFDTSSEAILITDGTKIKDCNDRAYGLFLHDSHTLAGKPLSVLFPAKQPCGAKSTDKARNFFEAAQSSSVPQSGWKMKRKDGTVFDASLALTTLQGKNNSLFAIRITEERIADSLQETNGDRKKFYELIGTLTSNLAGIDVEKTGVFLANSLKLIAEHYNVERIIVFTYDEKNEIPILTSYSTGKNLKPVTKALIRKHFDLFALYTGEVRRKEIISLRSATGAGQDGLTPFWQLLGIQSNMSVRLLDSDNFIAALSLSNSDRDYDWNDSILSDIRIIAGLLSGVIGRWIAKTKLAESENKYMDIFENSGNPTCILSGSHHQYANKAYCRLLGYAKNEILGTDFKGLLSEKDSLLFENLLLETASKKNEPFVFNVVLQKKNRKKFDAEIQISSVVSHKDSRCQLVLRNITQKREQEMIEKATLYSLDNIQTAVSWTDTEGNFIYINEAGCAHTGYSREEILRMKISDLHPDWEEHYWENNICSKLKEQGQLFYETEHFRKDGTALPVRINANYLKFEDNEIILLFAYDISREIELRKEQERYYDIMQNMQIGLYVFRLEDLNDCSSLRLKIVNNRASEKVWLDPEQSINKYIFELFPNLRPTPIPELWADVVRTGNGHENLEFTYRGARFPEASYNYKIFPLPDNCVGVLFDDVTEKARTIAILNAIKELSISLSRTDELASGLTQCLDEAIKISELTSGGIYLYDKENDTLNLIVHKGLSDEFVSKTNTIRADSPEMEIIKNNNRVYFNNEQLEKLLVGDLAKEGLKSMASAPIFYKDELLGAINLASKRHEQFPDILITLIEEIFVQVSGSIFRLMAQENLRKKNRALRILSEVNQVLIRSSNEKNLLDSVCNIVINYGYDSSWVAFKKEDGSLVPASFAGLDNHFTIIMNRLAKPEYRYECTAFKAIETGKPAITNNSGLIGSSENPASTIALPLSVNNSIIGALVINKDNEIIIDKDEIALLTELAEDLAFGISMKRIENEKEKTKNALLESEKRFKMLFNQASDSIFINDLGGILIEVNDEALRKLGYSSEELIGKTIRHIDSPENYDNLPFIYDKVLREGSAYFDTTLIGKSGNRIPIEMSSKLVEIEGNRFMFNIARDVTERLVAEKALKEKEENIRQVIENLPIAVGYTDMEFRSQYINKAFIELFGYTIEDVPTAYDWSVKAHPDEEYRQISLEKWNKYLSDVKKGLNVEPVEFLITKKNGEQVECELRNTIVNDKIINVFENLTERRKLEREMQTVIRSSMDGFMIINKDGTILETNNAYLQMVGYTREELLFRSVKELDVLNEEDTEIMIARLFETGNTRFESRHRRKDNTLIDLDINCVVPLNSPEKIYIFLKDITESKKAEEVIKKSEEKFRLLIETMNEGLATIGPNSIIGFVNKKFCNIFEAREDELLGRSFADMLDQESRAIFLDNWGKRMEGITTIYEISRTKSDNTRTYLRVSGTPLYDKEGNVTGSLGILTDITNQKTIENELRASEEKYRSLFRQAFDSVVLADADTGIIVDCNEAACNFFERTREEMIGQHQSLFHSAPVNEMGFTDSYVKSRENVPGKVIEDLMITGTGKIKNVDIVAGFVEMNGRKYIQGMFRDMTEYKKALRALKDSEEKFSRAFYSNPLAMMIVTVNGGRIVDVNDPITRLFKIGRETVIGKTTEEIGLMGTLQTNRFSRAEWIEELNETGRIAHKEISYMASDGRRMVVTVAAEALQLGDESCILYVIEDITEKKAAEVKLRESEELYRTLIETSIDAISMTSLDGKIILCNKREAEIFGYNSPEEMTGMVARSLIAPEEQDVVEEEFTSFMAAGEVNGVVHTVVRKDKSRFIGEFNSRLMKDSNGVPVSIMNVIRDITGRRKAEEAIIKSEENYRYIFNTAAVALWEVDLFHAKTTIENLRKANHDLKQHLENNSELFAEMSRNTNITNINRYCMSLYEAESKEEFLGSVHRIVSAENFKDHRDIIYAIIDHKEFMTFETSHLTLKGRKIDVLINTKLPEESTEYRRILFSITDISLSKQVEKELLAAKEKAEMLNQAKSQFYATISHELRTPLNGILGFSQLLRSMATDKDQADISSLIVTSGKRLLKTLNQILDITKIEAERYEMKLKSIDVSDVVFKNALLYKGAASLKNLYLEILIEEKELFCLLDEELLSGVCANIIDNAVKYTEKGGITVSLRTETVSDNRQAVISVCDTGIGIPSDKLELIFEEFRQVSEGIGRNFEGTGLGLSITKKYVEMMDGFIKVQSVPGKGTDFRVYFPVEFVGEKTMTTITDSKELEVSLPVNGIGNPDILLVEDDFVSQTLTSLALKKTCNVDVVDNGDDAIKKVKEKQYRLILMDINLGKGLTGLDTAAIIRGLPGYEDVPIVALTAYAMTGDKEEFLSRGCTHYLSKPFDIHQLAGLVKSLIEKSVSGDLHNNELA